MKQKRQVQKKQISKKKLQSSDMYARKVRNKETNMISFIFIGLFLLLAFYFVYFNIFIGPDVINSSYNKRIDNLAEKIVRGDIVSSDGTVLATTMTDEDGNEIRRYPYGNIFSHVIGFSTHGKSGIEKLCNFFLLSADDNFMEKLYAGINGDKMQGAKVVTTLNVKLQQAAWDALGNNKGAVVAMEPSTGKILAMVSKPDYDPNHADLLWEEWISYESQDSVLLNRATQGLYPPGSTFKILTALSFMRQDPLYKDFEYTCTGSITTAGASTIHCFDQTVHGVENLQAAFANSCNSAFASIGKNLNQEKFRTLCDDFLFNKELPLSIDYSESSFKLDGASSVSEVMETSIGQGRTQITPVHNLLIASAVANGGVMMQPYFIDKIVSGEKVVQRYEPKEYSDLLTKEETDELVSYMRSVVTDGTGTGLRESSYQAAGKTGSAQYDDSENHHSWFVGFAPYDSPEISVCVILEGGYKNVANAQVVAKKVLDAYFD